MRYTTAGRASYSGFPGQLLFRRKEEFAGNALQAAGSSAAADLCSWKIGRQRQRRDGNGPESMTVKGGTALPDINAGENEVEKSAAWGVRQWSAGANMKGILLIRPTPEFRPSGMKARGG